MKYNSFPSVPHGGTIPFLPSLIHLLFVTGFPCVICPYVSHTCDSSSNFTDGSTYSTNLNQVINDLVLNAPQSSGFNTSSRGQSPNRVYGLLQCNGDISAAKCSDCAVSANSSIRQRCSNDIGGRIWFDECFLHYHNSNFISTLDASGAPILVNTNTVTGEAFKSTTSSLLSNLSSRSYIPANKGFAAGSANYSASGELYGLVQCWRDLSIQDCRSCLSQARTNLNSCCFSNQGAQVNYGSCKVRFETYSFFESSPSPSPSPEGSTPNTSTPAADPPPVALSPNMVNGTSRISEKKTLKTLPIVLGTIGGIVLALGLCLIALRKRVKSVIYGSPTTATADNQEGRGFSSESGFLMQEQQQFVFSLETLVEATDNFHHKNKLGEGGFGAVYRGLTRDGNEIAVKKLSAKSAQGKNEFMNEVRLVANIQHRNLTKLLGCCAEGSERLLIYEYFPNKSLDMFIFDSEKGRELDRQKRHNIIFGIARGLLYLHEDSQLRIIHRDIKLNNILLDQKLNAKIADFGLARLFPEDESYVHTRVAGTYGYMAPEYAMQGQLSVKVDVYSFGAVLLEIISGRKNTVVDLPHHMQNLLEWAWNLFKKGNALNLVDSKASELNEEQALRCIHVGLLCVQSDATLRPAMSNVVMMLSSSSVTLPNPSSPAFVSMGTSSQTTSSSQRIPSINETSLTQMESR